jgi:hypothetical protein
MARITLTIRLQKKIHRELQNQAKKQGVSMNDLINILTRRGLDDLNPQTFRGSINQLLGFKLKKIEENNNDERMG